VTSQGRVVEHVLRSRPFGPKLRLRVDLHGISMFPAKSRHTLIRWEWIEDIAVEGGVVVRSATEEIRLPAGAFGRAPRDLAERLRAAGAITSRADVISELSEH
jgi:hypothetical protein